MEALKIEDRAIKDMLLILALRGRRQVDLRESEVNVVYIVSFRSARDT